MLETVLFIIIVFVAYLFQGITGFGSALLAMPLALFFFPKETVVCSLVFLGIPMNLYLVWKIKVKVDLKQVSLLVLASIVGMPVGVFVLQTISLDMMRLVVSLLSIVFTLVIFVDKVNVPRVFWTSILAGFLSGVLLTSVSMSGPPLVLLLTGQQIPKEQFRKILFIFFGVAAVLGSLFYLFAGLLRWENIAFGLYSIPFVLVAAWLGDLISTKVKKEIFRIIVLGTISLTALLGVFTSLSNIV